MPALQLSSNQSVQQGDFIRTDSYIRDQIAAWFTDEHVSMIAGHNSSPKARAAIKAELDARRAPLTDFMTVTGIQPQYVALMLKEARMKHLGSALDALQQRAIIIDRMLTICDPPDFARQLSGHAHELAEVLDTRWADLRSELEWRPPVLDPADVTIASKSEAVRATRRGRT